MRKARGGSKTDEVCGERKDGEYRKLINHKEIGMRTERKIRERWAYESRT